MGIGELNEGPLHAALKASYVANGGSAEVPVEGFVADAVRNGVIYEIQTGSFSGLTRKLSKLVEERQVVLVHPIAQMATMVKMPKEPGGKVTRRKAPKRGRLIDIVAELVYIPQLLAHENFSVDVVLTVEDEVREFDPRKSRRRGGWRIKERHLVEIVDGMRISGPADLLDFLQDDLPQPFSTAQLAVALGESVDIAQKMAYCLRHAGTTQISGKQGNALLYEYA